MSIKVLVLACACAFVCGFEQDSYVDSGAEARQEFPRLWNCKVNHTMSVDEAYHAVQELADDWIRRGSKLIVVKCGQVAERGDAVHQVLSGDPSNE